MDLKLTDTDKFTIHSIGKKSATLFTLRQLETKFQPKFAT